MGGRGEVGRNVKSNPAELARRVRVHLLACAPARMFVFGFGDEAEEELDGPAAAGGGAVATRAAGIGGPTQHLCPAFIYNPLLLLLGSQRGGGLGFLFLLFIFFLCFAAAT